MQIVSILFTLGILIFVGLFLYAPFLERRARRVTQEEQETSTLLAERERTLGALQELDFDYKLGKIPEEDYPTQRANLLQKGADILRRLDEIALASTQVDPEMPPRRHSDARIERAIASRRKKTSGTQQEVTDDDIESMISTRRKGRKTKTAGFCPKCGKPVIATDKFCPSCGKALS
jgi:rubrerythrin